MEADALRVGHGFDVHPFLDAADDPAKPLVLGGVHFEGAVGLVGHSDADVVAHACTDAILGAAGQDDIGTMFPDDDASLAGADSVAMLRAAAARLEQLGWSVVNVDCTIVLDTPKLAPRRQDIQRILSDAVAAPVTIKGKRTEGLVGLSGGIHCFAVALVRRA
jgi:2-C-methyl-D-erythritol 2,4-cyclodiphosphate synthase